MWQHFFQTPQYNRICKDLCRRGLLEIREQSVVTKASYTEQDGWEVTVGSDPEAPVEHFDYIVAATYVLLTSSPGPNSVRADLVCVRHQWDYIDCREATFTREYQTFSRESVLSSPTQTRWCV